MLMWVRPPNPDRASKMVEDVANSPPQYFRACTLIANLGFDH